MALVLVCACGSKLEIDEGFQGRAIDCPDCARPLRIQRTRPRLFGLALLGLGLSIIGFFTLLGSLAGATLGYWAKRRLEREPGRWSGASLAHVAFVLGCVGFGVSLFLNLFGERFYIDGFLRELRWSNHLNYPSELTTSKMMTNERRVRLQRPSFTWGVVNISDSASQTPELGMFHTWLDSFILCLSPSIPHDADEETVRARGLESLRESTLLKQFGRIPDDRKEGEIRDLKQNAQGAQEMLLDLRTGKVERTILVLIRKVSNTRIYVLAGGTRKSRFGAQEPTFRAAFDSFKEVD